MIFFSHVHRTAGSTIHSYFYPHFHPRGRHHVVSGFGELPAAAEKIRGLSDGHFYLGGHVGLHEFRQHGIPVLESDIVLATVRDPVERAVSLYYLMLRSPEWFPDVDSYASCNGFEYFYDYMRDRQLFFDNDHCAILSGQRSFGSTVQLIRSRFALVGACSRLAEFDKALEIVCAPLVHGFAAHSQRTNAAYHELKSSVEWTKRAHIHEVAGRSLREKILRENAEDARLVDFIEREHAGLFVGRAVCSLFPAAQGSAGPQQHHLAN